MNSLNQNKPKLQKSTYNTASIAGGDFNQNSIAMINRCRKYDVVICIFG